MRPPAPPLSKPVRACRTISYGIVFTPSFAPGLAISVDYFDIDIDDTISTYQANNTLDACYTFSNAQACSLINRTRVKLSWPGFPLAQESASSSAVRMRACIA